MIPLDVTLKSMRECRGFRDERTARLGVMIRWLCFRSWRNWHSRYILLSIVGQPEDRKYVTSTFLSRTWHSGDRSPLRVLLGIQSLDHGTRRDTSRCHGTNSWHGLVQIRNEVPSISSPLVAEKVQMLHHVHLEKGKKVIDALFGSCQTCGPV
jgi:hypothetical protein